MGFTRLSLTAAATAAILTAVIAGPGTVRAQANTSLSEAERVILGEVLEEVLGVPDDNTVVDDEDDKGKDKGKGKDKKAGLPPGLAKRDSLPPGLAKRDSLPPGLAKRLDDRLEDALPERDIDVTDTGIIITDSTTGAVVEVLKDVLTGTSQAR